MDPANRSTRSIISTAWFSMLMLERRQCSKYKSLSSAHDPPAIENDGLPGHEVGAARCEIANKLGNVLVRTHGAQRCFTNDRGKLFIRIELSNDRAVDKSERDRIHRDVWRKFERHALRQHVEPGL